jgi:hypothetical protein
MTGRMDDAPVTRVDSSYVTGALLAADRGRPFH